LFFREKKKKVNWKNKTCNNYCAVPTFFVHFSLAAPVEFSMRVAHFHEKATNFMSFARYFVRHPGARVVEVPTDAAGISLTVARISEQTVILIKDGRKAVGAVSLRQLRNKALREKFGAVYEPHAYVVKNYRGRGLVEGVYRWLLSEGLVFRSAPCQSFASNGLWRKLSLDFHCGLVHVQEARLIGPGDTVGNRRVRLILSQAPLPD